MLDTYSQMYFDKVLRQVKHLVGNIDYVLSVQTLKIQLSHIVVTHVLIVKCDTLTLSVLRHVKHFTHFNV